LKEFGNFHRKAHPVELQGNFRNNLKENVEGMRVTLFPLVIPSPQKFTVPQSSQQVKVNIMQTHNHLRLPGAGKMQTTASVHLQEP